MKQEFIIITKNNCSECSNAKSQLTDFKCDFVEHCILNPSDKNDIIEKYNIPFFISYPQIILFQNEEYIHIGSTNDLNAYLVLNNSTNGDNIDSVKISDITEEIGNDLSFLEG